MKFKFLIILSFLLLTLNVGKAQKKEKIKYQADIMKYSRENKEPVRKLLNNVIFKQGTLIIKCDSANFYNKRNIMEAYGNIIITDIDSLKISGNKLIYDGNNKTAKLRENVIYNIRQTKRTKSQIVTTLCATSHTAFLLSSILYSCR